jgi:hypothetical protein
MKYLGTLLLLGGVIVILVAIWLIAGWKCALLMFGLQCAYVGWKLP